MTRTRLSLFALLFAVPALPALANSITYSKIGTVAPQVLTYAASSGGITGYYMGSTAGFEDQIEVYDVETGYDSGKVLDNKTSAVGTSTKIGTEAGQINAGDQLVFYIDSPDGKFASVAADSADDVNHAYITAYSGGVANQRTIPGGYYIGMEDLPYGQSDLNYNDDDIVFTGITETAPVGTQGSSVTPEPGSFALFGTGVLAVLGGAWLRKRRVV